MEMYARGLSTRDIEATFRDEDGRCLLSRTAVSEVTEQLWEEYEAFATRDLSEFQVVYLFVDGVAERLHTGQRREMVLCAWGIHRRGREATILIRNVELPEKLRIAISEKLEEEQRAEKMVFTLDRVARATVD